MNLVFLTLLKAEQVFVILGGSSASNFNNYFYNATNSHVYSFDNGWVTAQSPMLGGDGTKGSPWAELGNSLYGDYNEEIYFIDCARINASIVDWNKKGEYYAFANNCLDIASNFSNRYSVLWQEGAQDNYYSYNSNYFLDTIKELIRPESDWFISISTYGMGEPNRLAKLQDVIVLTHNLDNVYLGAYIDSQCMSNPPYNQVETGALVDLWYEKIVEREKPLFIYSIYNDCDNWGNFSDFFLLLGICIILIFLCLGCFYSRQYYLRRRHYQEILGENDSNI